MIKAVIFDMDGVLIDSEAIYLEWLTDYTKKAGYMLSKEVLQKTIGLSSSMTAGYFDEILGRGTGEAFWDSFIEASRTYPFDYQEVLNPGVRDLLSRLKENKVKTGLASASGYKEIGEMLDTNNLREYFDVVLSGADFTESKPDPAIYLKAAETLAVAPEECIIIEDSTYGITAGKAAGAVVIAMEDNRFGFDQRQADYLVKDMNEAGDIILDKYNIMESNR